MVENMDLKEFGIAGVGGGVLTFLAGDITYLLWMLITFASLDWLVGFWQAYEQGVISSDVAWKKTVRKFIGYFAVVVIANMTGVILGFSALRELAVGFLVAREGIGILEHLAALGVEVPPILKDVIGRLEKGKEEKDAVKT